MRCLRSLTLIGSVVLATATTSCDWRVFLPRMEMPVSLQTPRVLVGDAVLSRRSFVSATGLGVVSDIQWSREGEELVVVGDRGASFLSITGVPTATVAFGSMAGHVEVVRPSPDGPIRFLNRGGGWQPVALFDDEGNQEWSYGPSPSPNDVSPGDLDGDGSLEFVVGMNGGGGVHALDESGARLWTRDDGNVWHVEVVDLGDGTPEILHSNASGVLTRRNEDGDLVDRVTMPCYVSDFQVLRRDDRVLILAADESVAYLNTIDGNVVRELEAPLASDRMTPFGTFVRLLGSDEPEFALLMEMSLWERSILYVFAPSGDLLYHEVLDDDCREIFALSGASGEQTLLLGCTGSVWEYAPESPSVGRAHDDPLDRTLGRADASRTYLGKAQQRE